MSWYIIIPAEIRPPSSDDRLLTRRVQNAGDMLGIPLLDHVILGDHSYISFKEQDLM